MLAVLRYSYSFGDGQRLSGGRRRTGITSMETEDTRVARIMEDICRRDGWTSLVNWGLSQRKARFVLDNRDGAVAPEARGWGDWPMLPEEGDTSAFRYMYHLERTGWTHWVQMPADMSELQLPFAGNILVIERNTNV